MKKTKWILPSEKMIPQGTTVQKQNVVIVGGALDKAETDLREALDLLEYFTNRVEAGTIRSKTTYAMYTNFISKFKEAKIIS